MAIINGNGRQKFRYSDFQVLPIPWLFDVNGNQTVKLTNLIPPLNFLNVNYFYLWFFRSLQTVLCPCLPLI